MAERGTNDGTGAQPTQSFGRDNIHNARISADGDLDIVMSSNQPYVQTDAGHFNYNNQSSQPMLSLANSGSYRLRDAIDHPHSGGMTPPYNLGNTTAPFGSRRSSNATDHERGRQSSRNHYQFAGSTLAPPNIVTSGNMILTQGDWYPTDNIESTPQGNMQSDFLLQNGQTNSRRGSRGYYPPSPTSYQGSTYVHSPNRATHRASREPSPANANVVRQHAVLKQQAMQLQMQAADMQAQSTIDRQQAAQNATTNTNPREVEQAFETHSGRYGKSYHFGGGQRSTSMEGFFDG